MNNGTDKNNLRAADNINRSDLEQIKEQETIADNNISSDIIPLNNSNNTTKYNVQNLKPYNKTDRVLTSEEAKKRGRTGGIKSGEARKARKTMRDTILELIQKEVDPTEYGGDADILGDRATLQEVILAAMVREATNGDTKAMQLLRDTIGEQPVNRQEIKQEVITQDDLKTISNLKDYLTG